MTPAPEGVVGAGVLEWLDCEIWSREGVRSSGAHAAGYTEAKAARAAVAELIEAATDSVPDMADSTLDGHLTRYDRLRAALSRVQSL
jgi:hypothetical protein